MAFLTLIMGSHNVFYVDTFMRRLPRTHSQFSCLENVKTQEEEEDDLFSIFFIFFPQKNKAPITWSNLKIALGQQQLALSSFEHIVLNRKIFKSFN